MKLNLRQTGLTSAMFRISLSKKWTLARMNILKHKNDIKKINSNTQIIKCKK